MYLETERGVCPFSLDLSLLETNPGLYYNNSLSFVVVRDLGVCAYLASVPLHLRQAFSQAAQ